MTESEEILKLARLQRWESLVEKSMNLKSNLSKEAMCCIAYAQIKTRNFNSAQKILEQLNKQHPGDPEVLTNLSYLLMELEKYLEASKLLEASTRLYSDNFQMKRNLGLCYMHLQQFEDGNKTLMEALSIKPEDPETIVDLALSYFALGKYYDARNLLAKNQERLHRHPRARALDYELQKKNQEKIWE